MSLVSQLFSLISSANSANSNEGKLIIGSPEEASKADIFAKLFVDQKKDINNDDLIISDEMSGDIFEDVSEEIIKDISLNIDEPLEQDISDIDTNLFIQNIKSQENFIGSPSNTNNVTKIRFSENNDSFSHNILPQKFINFTQLNFQQNENLAVKDQTIGILKLSIDINNENYQQIELESGINSIKNINYLNILDKYNAIPNITSQEETDNSFFKISSDNILIEEKGKESRISESLTVKLQSTSSNNEEGLSEIKFFSSDSKLEVFDDFVSKTEKDNHLFINEKDNHLFNNIDNKDKPINTKYLINGNSTPDNKIREELRNLTNWSNHVSKQLALNINVPNKRINFIASLQEKNQSNLIPKSEIISGVLPSILSKVADKNTNKAGPLLNTISLNNNNKNIEGIFLNNENYKNDKNKLTDGVNNSGVGYVKNKSIIRDVELSKISIIDTIKNNGVNNNLTKQFLGPEAKYSIVSEDGFNLLRENINSVTQPSVDLKQAPQLGQMSESSSQSIKDLQIHLHKQVINQLWKIGKIGQSRAILELEPKELGKVVVTLEMNKGQDGIKLVLHTETQQAAQVLQQDVSKLRQLYAGFGIDLQDFHASKDTSSGHDRPGHDRGKPLDDSDFNDAKSKEKSGREDKKIVGQLDVLA